jgi:hypothetical protein
VVRLVVEDNDLFLARQLATHAPYHLVSALDERARFAPGQDAFGEPRGLASLAQQERVIVGDDDAGLAETLE